jgi:hypothetical protein
MTTAGLVGMKHPSLAAMVDAVKTKISREGLHLRFTTAAVAFMIKCVTFVLHQKVNALCVIDANLLRHFKKVHIVDSSGWDIDPALKGIFPGSGGGASTANCKIQLCYEYLHGVISFFEIMAGTKSDNGYSSRLPDMVAENELLITDLGYFCLKTFHRICSRGAFFLSRLLVGTNLFDPRTDVSIDLCAALKNVASNAYELPIIMGAKDKNQIACRLICLRVSEEVANQRRRRMIKKSKKNKHAATSIQNLFLADWIDERQLEMRSNDN